MSFANAPWGSKPEMAKIGVFGADVQLIPLLSKEIKINRIVLEDAEILLETDKQGRGNWVFDAPGAAKAPPAGTPAPSSQPSQAAPLPHVGEVLIKNFTLTYRDEYPRALAPQGTGHDHGVKAPFRVQLLQEYLADKLPELGTGQLQARARRSLQLFGHCTERTEAVKSQEQWRAVFRHFGVEVAPMVTGLLPLATSSGISSAMVWTL